MARDLPARILLAAAALAACCAATAAQDSTPAPAPAPVQGTQNPAAAPADPSADRAERIRHARERWAAMSPEERARVRARFEQWRKLTPEQRDELHRRLEDMGGREGAAVVRRRMEEMRKASPERLQRMRVQLLVIGAVWQRFLGQLPPAVADQWTALPAPAKERLARRFARGLVEMGKEAIVRKYATEDERKALDGPEPQAKDPQAKRAALESMKKRIHEAVLAPHAEELEKLPPEERKVREVRLLEEHFWACAQEGLPEKLPQFRAAFEKALAEGPPPAGKPGREGPGSEGPGRLARGWFLREFGLPPEDLGVPWAGRALVRALRLRAPQDRPAFLQAVRPELRRIAALPLRDRDEELKALLERLK